MSRAIALGTVAVLALIVCPSHASPPALEPAWQRITARLGVAARAVGPELDAALADLSPVEVAAAAVPAEEARLRALLSDAGLIPAEIAAIEPLLLEAARTAASPGGIWAEPVVAVGPFALTVTELHHVVGPREGRDRRDVVARLRATVRDAGAGWSHGELEALVPELVAAAERATAERLVARLRLVLLPGEDQR